MATISTEGWPVQILPFKSSKNFPISLSGHMVLVFKDDDGNEFHINAGPHLESYPFGQLDLRDISSPLTKRINVVDGSRVGPAWRGNTRVDLDGRDPAQIWDILVRHARNIHRADIPYGAITANSNAVIGALLDVVGIDIQKFLPNPRGIMLGGFIGADTELAFNFSLSGTDGDDILRGRGGRQTFRGLEGDDHLSGGFGRDTLFGNAGRDVLIGGQNHDRLWGGTGSDELSGGPGNDILRGGQGTDVLAGDQGHDRLLGGDGDDALDGGFGNDTLLGGDGNDILRGRDGDDTLIGTAGDDRLLGGDGDDILRGGAGADRLVGGDGADTFVFRNLSDSGLGAEADTIVDFEQGQDLIDLEALADGLAFAGGGLTGTGPSFTLEEAGGDTRVQIDVDGDGAADMRITLKDVIGLGADDFIF